MTAQDGPEAQDGPDGGGQVPRARVPRGRARLVAALTRLRRPGGGGGDGRDGGDGGDGGDGRRDRGWSGADAPSGDLRLREVMRSPHH